jgi:hypothetical protein
MASPRTDVRLIAAVPRHPETERTARRLLPRCARVGVEIALVGGDGTIGLLPATGSVEDDRGVARD